MKLKFKVAEYVSVSKFSPQEFMIFEQLGDLPTRPPQLLQIV